ncbi:MAG: hypothetical protein ACKOU6_01270, partial [Planctomycetota bacterium]
ATIPVIWTPIALRSAPSITTGNTSRIRPRVDGEAPSTIGRILDLFPEEMHGAIRSAIAFNMKGIVAQKLLRSIKPGVPRVPTCEVMLFNPTIRKLILEGQDHKLPDAIRIGAEEGMQDFTMSLKGLIDDGLIDRPTAFEVAPNPDALKMALKGINVSAPGIL